MVSVIIPARNEEKWLQKTIDSIRANARGEIEVIVILDGNSTFLLSDTNTINHSISVGRRVSCNEAARLAKGDFLFFLDAHCTMSENWDVLMAQICDEKVLVISQVCPLSEVFEPKKALYTTVALDFNLQDKWWGDYSKGLQGDVVESMAFTGCGWMIRKDYFWELGGFDEALKGYGHTGSEWSLKVWLSGGRILLHRGVICGHKFGTNVGNVLYVPDMLSQEAFKAIMYGKYGGEAIEAYRAKFNPPGWDVSAVTPGVKIKEETKIEIRRRTKVDHPENFAKETADLPWVTAYMLYYGRYDLAQEAMESFLAQTYPNKRMLIINTHPDPVCFAEDFEKGFGGYYYIEVQNLPDSMFSTLNDKYNYAFSQVKTPWCAPWDDDDIYLPWHLENLVKNIPNCPRGDFPRKIGGRFRFSSRNNQIAGIKGKMWGCCLFETFDKEGKVYPVCDGNVTVNADRQIGQQSWSTYWLDQRIYPLSFIYRWGTGESHGSSHTGDRGLDHAKKMREQKNAIPLKEPWRPHWKRDYIADARNYFLSNPEVPRIVKMDGTLMTAEEHAALIPEVK